MDNHQQFVHFHNGSTLIGTWCFLLGRLGDQERCLGYGWSFPSKRDTATKARGRAIASGRATKMAMGSILPYNIDTILRMIEEEVPICTRRGFNSEQFTQKMEQVRRWFFPQPQ